MSETYTVAEVARRHKENAMRMTQIAALCAILAACGSGGVPAPEETGEIGAVANDQDAQAPAPQPAPVTPPAASPAPVAQAPQPAPAPAPVPFAGRKHHADWCAGINHPDARLIEAAPRLLAALLPIADAREAVAAAMPVQAATEVHGHE